jgi:putative ABC transport system ATP-binding protein
MQSSTAARNVEQAPVPAAPAIVRFHDVVKTYEEDGLKVEAIRGVTFTIARGRFTTIIGPSGSGKTTLLNLVGCIDKPTRGRLEVCGEDIAAMSDDALTDFRSRRIAFVFQSFNLFPVLTAYENVEYPLLLLRVPTRERRDRVTAIMDAVGLGEFRDHRPNQLSGGQKQRVAIARSLVKRPALVLADEPTANLDTKTGAEIIALMRRVQRDHDASFVFSTHDPQLMSHAEDIVMLRDGVVVEGAR